MSKVHLTVLGFINFKPMHGYEIMNTIKTKGMDIWAGIKMPSVYNALQHLENKAYIKGTQEVEGNNPPRNVYHMTDSGLKYFKKLILSYLQNDVVGVDYWLAISFTYRTMSKNEYIALLNSRLEHLEAHLLADNECQRMLETQSQQGKIPFIHKHLLRMGSGVHSIEIKLLKDIIEEAQLPENNNYFIEENIT
ncbi:MAG TPA: PadR family transcriptional regulator [Candidatus Cloacimonadota bacterium]|nr:PadR family transcriptional regulator [Candidatus Cloacimonadota bacterium]